MGRRQRVTKAAKLRPLPGLPIMKASQALSRARNTRGRAALDRQTLHVDRYAEESRNSAQFPDANEEPNTCALILLVPMLRENYPSAS